MKLALGPLHYYWTHETVRQFYRDMADTSVDIVYLGETVCSRRHELRLADWLDIAHQLKQAGKEVILSSQVLLESESDLKTLRQIISHANDFTIEANDMGAVHLLSGKALFVAGPHLNLFNAHSLRLMASLGAKRWVTPLEMSGAQLAALQSHRPANMETEIFAWGRLPLAWSARCFTARAHNLPKDDCQFRCLDYPQGLLMNTREDKAFLVLNGIQTQSAHTHNLLPELDALYACQVDILRISPQPEHTRDIVALFRNAIDTTENPACRQQTPEAVNTLQALAAFAPQGLCNGYWYGQPGMAQQNTVQRNAAQRNAAQGKQP